MIIGILKQLSTCKQFSNWTTSLVFKMLYDFAKVINHNFGGYFFLEHMLFVSCLRREKLLIIDKWKQGKVCPKKSIDIVIVTFVA